MFADGAFLRRFQYKIHIKLPTISELNELIEKKLEAKERIKHNVLPFEIDILADTMCEKGFSPFDVDRLIGHVATKKLSAFKLGTHYKKDKFGCYFMCKESEPNAVKMTYKKVKTMEFKLPIISMKDMKEGLKVIKPTNSKNADMKFDEFKMANNLK